MKKYKAMLGGVAHYADDVSGSAAVLGISVGQPYHEDEKFAATMALMNTCFGSCDVLVADTLQRYNMLDCDFEAASAPARLRGDAWLARNAAALQTLTVPHNVIRWDECLQSPAFKSSLDAIKKRYSEDEEYRRSFQRDVDEFLRRHKTRNGSLDEHLESIMRERSLLYLFEEIAVFLSYFVERGYNFLPYPGTFPESYAMSWDLFLAQQHPTLCRNVRIYFRSR
jgi:tRNA-dependent cyclodipeptide synthase